jgi:Ca2+-binding EF-hand superfamily protein
LEELVTLTDQQKLETLFALMDKDRDGSVSAGELADGLRKIRGELSFEESIQLAIGKVANFDKNHDGKLDIDEFYLFMTKFAESLGSNFNEVSEILVMTVLFSGTGNTKKENDIVQDLGAEIDQQVKETKQRASQKKAERVHERMTAIFDIFDVDGDGTVDFKEVVLGMYKITEAVDYTSKAAVQALLFLDHKGTRSMNLDQFSRFIIGVAASVPGVSLDDICDVITKSAAEDVVGISSLGKRFSLDQQMETVQDLAKGTQEEVDALKGVKMGRLNKLFDLFDLDKDGSIDFHELALGVK